MAIDFEKIRTDNIREYGEGTRHLAFLGKLYPDRTHFIYELLQNAEDVKATSVKFTLHLNRLEFEHNGRLFNEADVRGICGVGEGTKSDDLTLIGKFGIGFKSVYAISNNPEVHSGKDHFRIEHYVRPYDCDVKTPVKGHNTLFIFPFDREDVDAPLAFDELQESLKNMPTHTILFLKHIKKIHIMINGDVCLTLSKQIAANYSSGTSEVMLTNGKFHKENYLLFSKPVPHSNADLSVEISYQFTKEGTPVRPWNTSLVVFFPTEKPTNLGFLIQGPYRTTPARDNIPAKDDFNKQLIELTAELMVESLVWLRDNNYLNENTYDLLPLDETYFPSGSMFRPFFDKLVKAFSAFNLLMTSTMNSTGSVVYSLSQEIAIARSVDLRQLVDNSMLNDLTIGVIKYWLNGVITEQTKPIFYRYLKDKLNIREWRLEDFVSKVEKSVLINRDDQWMIKFYRMILTQKQWFSSLKNYKSNHLGSIFTKVPFLSKEIIRLQSGEHVKPFKDSACLEPSAYISELDVPGFPIVKNALLDDVEIRSFFDLLGYTKPNETEYVIEHVLPNLSNTEDEELGDHLHLIDRAQKIIEAWSNGNNEQKKLIIERIKEKKWIPAHSFVDPEVYRLVDAFSCFIKNHETTLFLQGSNEHFYACDELTDDCATLLALGLCDKVKVIHRKPSDNGHVKIKEEWGLHVRGLHKFDPGAEVDGLIHALCSSIKDRDLDRERFIWNNIAVPNKHLIKGMVEYSSRKTFEDSKILEETSIFGGILSAAKRYVDGLRQKNGENELTIADLPEGFIRDLELAEILEIEIPVSDPISDLAREIGLSKEIVLEIKNNPELAPEISALILKLIDKSKKMSSMNTPESDISPEFPNIDVHDPERRAETVSDNVHEAPDKTYEKKERSVRVSDKAINKNTYLKNFYTNSNDEMVCQLCKKIMPFKKRNGEYYFEAVELLTKEIISKESESLCLALCPTCAAKYKEFIKQDNSKIQAMIKQIRSSEIGEIAIETDRHETMRFNPPHYLDIRTILTELLDPE